MVTEDDRVQCWGANSEGQLGDGTRVSHTDTVDYVANLENVASIHLGTSSSCAVIRDGTVACWGANNRLQLGVEGVQSRLSPVRVPGLAGVSSLSVGYGFTCANRVDGSVVCWGAGDGDGAGAGQLGDGIARTEPRAEFQPVVGVTNAVDVSSLAVSCAVLGTGALRCWGDYNGGAGYQYGSTPRVPFATSITTTAVVTGAYVSCGLTSTGRAYCWGTPFLVGTPSGADPYEPSYARHQGRATSLAVTNYRAFIVLDDHELQWWQESISGTNAALFEGVGDAAVVAAYESSMCILRTDGSPACWDVRGAPSALSLPSIDLW